MSETQYCKTCRKNLVLNDFRRGKRLYKTCHICRGKKAEVRGGLKNICETCGINAIFNYPEFSFGARCSQHKELTMQDIKHKRCLFEGCEKIPWYGAEGVKTGTFCAEHKLPDSVYVGKRILCISEGCDKRAVCSETPDSVCRFCIQHSPVGAINKAVKLCAEKGCEERGYYCSEEKPNELYCKIHSEAETMSRKHKEPVCSETGCTDVAKYNFADQTKALFCKQHASDIMRPVNRLRCLHEGCTLFPGYNYRGETKGLYCETHIPDDTMVVVHGKRCENEACQKWASFNHKGQKSGRFCKEHCPDANMVNVRAKQCAYEECETAPTFNFEGEKKGIFCFRHKLPHMVSMSANQCISEGCHKTATYNYESEKQGQYCFLHCPDELMCDVVNRKCRFANCNTRAIYGYLGQPATACAKHQNNTLMFAKRYESCLQCDSLAEYGPYRNPLRCLEHRLSEDYCLQGQTCVGCLRENELCNKDGYCITYCKPDIEFSKAKAARRLKELYALDYVSKNTKTYFTHKDDCVIDSVCVKRRPDRIYDCLTYFLVIEVDENQHSGYSCGVYDRDTTELRRMVQIHEAVNMGQTPVLFLRYNPDTYKPKEGQKRFNTDQRLQLLAKWVQKCLELPLETFVEGQIAIKYLFYDDFDQTDLSFEYIDDETISKVL